MQMQERRLTPPSDIEPAPCELSPVNDPKLGADARVPHRPEPVDKKTRAVEAKERGVITEDRKSFWRILDTIMGWILITALFIWKYVLRNPFSGKLKQRSVRKSTTGMPSRSTDA